MKKKMMILAVLAIISNCCCFASGLKFEENLLDVISKGDLDELTLKNSIPMGNDEFFKFNQSNTNKIIDLEEGMKWWIKTSLPSSVKEQLIKKVFEDLNLEKQELKLGNAVIDEFGLNESGFDAKKVEKLEESVASMLDNKREQPNSTFTTTEVETFKKWLLASKIFNFTGIGSVNTFDFIPWIVKLKKDQSLLHKLSDNVKVTVWPLKMNYSNYLSGHNNIGLVYSSFKEEVGTVKTELDKINNKELQDEMNLRMKLIDNILSGATTLETVIGRTRIYERIMGTLVKQLQLRAINETTSKFELDDFEKQVIKNWLLVNQMFYATEQVTASGGFVKALPEGGEFPFGYELPSIKSNEKGLLSPERDEEEDQNDDGEDANLHLRAKSIGDSKPQVVEDSKPQKKKKKNWPGFSFMDKFQSEKIDEKEGEKKKEAWFEKLINIKTPFFGKKNNKINDDESAIVATEVVKTTQLPNDENKPKSLLGSLFGGKSKATEKKTLDTGKTKEDGTTLSESNPSRATTTTTTTKTAKLKAKYFPKNLVKTEKQVVEPTTESSNQEDKKVEKASEIKTKSSSWWLW